MSKIEWLSDISDLNQQREWSVNYIQYVDQQYSDTGHGTRASTAENASVEQITIKFLQRSLQQVIGRSNNSYKGIRINNVNK